MSYFCVIRIYKIAVMLCRKLILKNFLLTNPSCKGCMFAGLIKVWYRAY